jgi:hypothetical protein
MCQGNFSFDNDGVLCGDDEEYIDARGEAVALRHIDAGFDNDAIIRILEQDYILFCNPRAY